MSNQMLRIGVLAGVLSLATACEDQGPMEKVGESIDASVEEVREEANVARERVEDAAKEAKQDLDEATGG